MYEEKTYKPLSPWAYFGYEILFSIPIVGLVLLIVFSFTAKNVNLKNFARSFFCGLALVIILIFIIFALSGAGIIGGKLAVFVGNILKNIKIL